MKKIIIFLLAIITMVEVLSQNVNIRFTGVLPSGQYIKLDSVRVQNISRNWTETLLYPDTVLTFNFENISTVTQNETSLKSYPNPFNGKTMLSLQMAKNDNLTLQIFTLSGQKIIETSQNFEQGTHLFEIALKASQVYILVATNSTSRSTIKLVNKGMNGANYIKYNGLQIVGEKRISLQNFQHGDSLTYVGFATTFDGDTILSNTICQRQTESEDISLLFTPTKTLPEVSTLLITTITDSSALFNGDVLFDGYTPISERGFCWSTSQNPTITDNHIADTLATTGGFYHNISGFLAATTYYVRAYATNSLGTAYGEQRTFTTTLPGALNGYFSVSSSRQVRFSQGNLQWSAIGSHVVAGGDTITGTWRFATNQYDTIGRDNQNISSSYTGWIDLFGWGTSGYHNSADTLNTNYQPYSTSTRTANVGTQAYTYNSYGYGPSTNQTNPNISDSYYDWGDYNAISNGGNRPNIWRTLTKDEWNYLLCYRNLASSKYGIACVNGINGLVLLPDNWTLPAGLSFNSGISANNGSQYFALVNNYTLAEWQQMEIAGAVFLPTTSFRSGGNVGKLGTYGDYHLATYDFVDYAYHASFYSNNVSANGSNPRYKGLAVRLVYSSQNISLPIVTTLTPTLIGDTFAVCGGNVLSDGGDTIIARGVCWSTSQYPTLHNNFTTDSSGIGNFVSNIDNLRSNTTYYIRAYATNSLGTIYGEQEMFTTGMSSKNRLLP